MDLREMLENIQEKIGNAVTVKKVFGDPITAEGRTIIPVAKIGFGFGGGGGKGTAERGEGGGAGGGGGAHALGVFEVTAQATRFIPIHPLGGLAGTFAAGMLMGYFMGRRRRR